MSAARQVRVEGRGGPEVLHVRPFDPKAPGRGEVRVRVRRAGVAYGDVMRRRGVLAPPWGFTPGYDIVGEVDAIGARVDGVVNGARVAVFMPSAGFCGYATHVNVPADRLVTIPDSVGWDAAIAFGLNAITARQLLTRVAPVGPGQTVLMHGAAGGVGTVLLDQARLMGVSVIGTASAGKHEVVRARGGQPIDYRSEDFVARARELTGGRGADVVIDGIGGEHLLRSWDATCEGGTLVSLGISGDVGGGLLGVAKGMRHPARLKLRRGKRFTVYGITVSPGCGALATRDDWAWLLGQHAAGELPAPLIETLPLDQVAEAHARLERADVMGKLALRVD